jgi:hypothetical protein
VKGVFDMAETAMRGTRIGSVSYEVEGYVEPAERMTVLYRCPQGHELAIPISIEAEGIPQTWDCRCGDVADVVSHLDLVAVPEAKAVKPTRTHWDMLLERRTIADLEELLQERLALLHGAPLRKSA